MGIVLCSDVGAPLRRSAHSVCQAVTGQNATAKQQQALNPGPVKRGKIRFYC